MPPTEPPLHERSIAAFSNAASGEGKPLSIDAACKLLETPEGEVRVAYGFGAALVSVMRTSDSYIRCFHPRQSQHDVATYLKSIFTGEGGFITNISQSTPLASWHFNNRGPAVVLDNASSGYSTRLENVTSFTRAEYGNDGKKYTCIYVAAEQDRSHAVDNLMVCEYTNKGITVTQFLPPSVYNEETYESDCRAIQYTYAWDIKNDKVVGAVLTPRVLVGNVHIDRDGLVSQFRNPFACLVKDESDLGMFFDTTGSDIAKVRTPTKRSLTVYSNREKFAFKPFPDRVASALVDTDAPAWFTKPAARLSKLVQHVAQKHTVVGTIDIPNYIEVGSTVGLETMIFQPDDRIHGYKPLLLDENIQWITEFLASQAYASFKPTRKSNSR